MAAAGVGEAGVDPFDAATASLSGEPGPAEAWAWSGAWARPSAAGRRDGDGGLEAPEARLIEGCESGSGASSDTGAAASADATPTGGLEPGAGAAGRPLGSPAVGFDAGAEAGSPAGAARAPVVGPPPDEAVSGDASAGNASPGDAPSDDGLEEAAGGAPVVAFGRASRRSIAPGAAVDAPELGCGVGVAGDRIATGVERGGPEAVARSARGGIAAASGAAPTRVSNAGPSASDLATPPDDAASAAVVAALARAAVDRVDGAIATMDPGAGAADGAAHPARGGSTKRKQAVRHGFVNPKHLIRLAFVEAALTFAGERRPFLPAGGRIRSKLPGVKGRAGRVGVAGAPRLGYWPSAPARLDGACRDRTAQPARR